MADAKQDNNKKKEVNSEGAGFKTVMGGFDKNEVNLYINKLRKQMKEQAEEYEKRLNNLQTNLEDANKEVAKAKVDKKSAEQAAAAASAPIIKDSSAETKKLIDNLKAESDKKIMELRKSILDERRNVAKFDKECAMAKMSEKKVREEYEKLKDRYLTLKKSGGGTVSGKAVAKSNADEVMAEASAYAKEIIAAAKSYSAEAVRAADKYKAEVEAELKERSDKLNDIKSRLEAQIRKTEAEQAESAKKVKEVTGKIGALTSLFDSFALQFSSVNTQISGVTENIDSICKQFNETTGQIGSVAKQISDTTSQIDSVSKQINETTSQIDSVSKQINETSSQITGFARTISETTEKINDASRQMNETTGMITEASRKMNETTGMISETSKKISETSGLIDEASKQMSGFGDKLNSAKSGVDDITKIVDEAKSKLDTAKSGVSEAQTAADSQASAADLSPIAKIGEEIALAVGSLKARFVMPEFDDSKFSADKFDAIKRKLKVEATIESDGSAPDVADDDDFEDSDIISSIEIDSPETNIPSDDDLMADVPDVITAPVFEETKPEPEPEPAKPAVKEAPRPDNSAKAERPGLDADFEDFFLTEPKDDDLSGDIPLINMEGVGVVDDFSLDAAPEPIGGDFDITPIDKASKPDKGSDLGADIFDIAIDPAGTDDDTLANMMADASKAEQAANRDFTPADLNFDEENTLPSSSIDDDFGEFADLFAAGSSQTSSQPKKNEKPAFKSSSSNDDWGFGSDPGADSDLSDLLI